MSRFQAMVAPQVFENARAALFMCGFAACGCAEYQLCAH
jgi:hypothetical protein